MAAADIGGDQRLDQGDADAAQPGGEDQPQAAWLFPAQGIGQGQQQQAEGDATALAEPGLQTGAAQGAEAHGGDGQGGQRPGATAVQAGGRLDAIQQRPDGGQDGSEVDADQQHQQHGQEGILARCRRVRG